MEDIIWDHFNNIESDFMLANYLPQLKKYDGIQALLKKLSECEIPSDRSRIIARLLYESIGDDSYLDIFKDNYIKSKGDRYPIVSELSHCKPGQKMFELLCDIYLNSDEKLVVQEVTWSLFFYINGIDSNTISLTEEMKYISMINPLIECKKSEKSGTIKENKIIDCYT